MRTEKNTKPLSVALMLLVAVFSIGCTTTAPTIDSSPAAEVTFDGLHEVLNSAADKAWAKRGVLGQERTVYHR